jgi:hypothetical protein
MTVLALVLLRVVGPMPSPIILVSFGTIHVVLMVMVPAGSRMVAGVTTAVAVDGYFHGVSPDGQVRLLTPRASITAPVVFVGISAREALILAQISVLELVPATALASMKADDPVVVEVPLYTALLP